MTFKIGDCVSFAYAWPGPDITEMRVEKIDGDKLTGWDLGFGFEVTMPADKCWLTKDQILDMPIHVHDRTTTYRQLLSERAAVMSTPADRAPE